MAHHDVIAIGASAGGFRAIRRVAGGLPGDFDASVLIVTPVSSEHSRALPDVLAARIELPVKFAEQDEDLRRGQIYVAPPDRHLLVMDGKLRLGSGPWENGARPAIDPLFRSVALSCGPRAIGVMLAGSRDDGSSGLRAIRNCGGLSVVQDPGDDPELRVALSPAEADHSASLSDLAALLVRLAPIPAGLPASAPADLQLEVQIAARGGPGLRAADTLGVRSGLGCPACHGALWQIEDGEAIRYRCALGHAYSAEALSVALNDDLGRALAAGLRALEEKTALMRRLARDAELRERPALAREWREKAHACAKQADLIRRSLARF